MIVYSATRRQFSDDVGTNQIEDRILDAFRTRLGRSAPPSEVQAWKSSMQYMNNVLVGGEVPDDAGVAIEYTIPQSAKRIDFILTGRDENGHDNAVIVELKQWTEVTATNQDGIVETFVGGRQREVPHPSYQAWSYAALLRDFNEAVQEEQILLHPCAYLHNCHTPETIRAERYKQHTELAPAFLKRDAERLQEFIARFVRQGDQRQILYKIEHGRIRPSKNLADHLLSLLAGNREFILIDDQKVVYEKALALAKRAREGKKQVLIVDGGPGTGKSVVAINLLVELTRRRSVVHYVTRNAAPRTVYEAKLAGSWTKSRISNLFKGSGAYVGTERDAFDALVVDEAHRLNEKSGLYKNQGENQIKEIIHAAKLSVFFLDEDQRVTLRDIGEAEEIERWAARHDAEVQRLELSSQFRCNGSDGYLAWVDHALQIRETANPDLADVDYDFRVFDDPNELFRAIVEKNVDNKARMVAGYCWDWKGKKDPTIRDVTIPEHGFAMKWNLAEDVNLWILRPDSVNEIGCIHTSQGLELDHVGVIIGEDLVVRDGRVVIDGAKRSSQDSSIRGYKKMLKEDPTRARAMADRVVKNTYRALMTRGRKSCYLFCVDPETNAYFKKMAEAATAPEPIAEERYPGLTLPILNPSQARPYDNAVPVFDLEMAAAYDFSAEQPVESHDWVELPESFRARRGHFVARVVGESMNRRIPNGSWCLFLHNPGGTRDGKIVIVEHRGLSDAETGTRCTIKLYSSEKVETEEGWEHRRITLKPASTVPRYRPIELEEDSEGEVRVVGELVAVLT